MRPKIIYLFEFLLFLTHILVTYPHYGVFQVSHLKTVTLSSIFLPDRSREIFNASVNPVTGHIQDVSPKIYTG